MKNENHDTLNPPGRRVRRLAVYPFSIKPNYAMKPTQLLELVLRAIPYPHQIKEIEMSETELRFNWRSSRYVVDTQMNVETAENGCLVGCDKSILMSALIKREYAASL